MAVRVAAVVLLAGLTLSQQTTFSSDVALWENAVIWAPEAVRPALNLGAAYRRAGQRDAAVRWLIRAGELLPQERWRDDYRCAVTRQFLWLAAFGDPVCHTPAASRFCSC